jgi:bifunctional ADP-heptose synthase (sugar kinase/adenylyltransferase)
MKEIKMGKVPILVNGKPDNMFLYSGVDTLIINKKEKKEMLEKLKSIVIPEPTITDLAAVLKIKNIIVTYGEDGICSYTENGITGTSFGFKVSVKDITGAGDVVTAIVAYCMCSGQTNIQNIIDLANYGGAIKVQREKTAVVTLKDIEPELEDPGVLDYETLVQNFTKEPEDS